MMHVCCSLVKEAENTDRLSGSGKYGSLFILYTKYFLFSSEVNWNQWECCVAGLLASPRTRLPADFIQLQIKRSTLLPLLFPKLRFPWYSSLCPSFVHQSHEYQRVHYISLDPMSEMENRQGGFLPRPENAVASSSAWGCTVSSQMIALRRDVSSPPSPRAWLDVGTRSGNCLVKTFSAQKTTRTRGEMVH